MADRGEMNKIKRESRLGLSPGVDKIEVGNLEGQEAFVAIEQWLDELGIWGKSGSRPVKSLCNEQGMDFNC